MPTAHDLVETGVLLHNELDGPVTTSDVQSGKLRWGQIYDLFGSLKRFNLAVQLALGGEARRQAMVVSGIRAVIEKGRDVSSVDFVDFTGFNEKDIVQTFGSWARYHEEICPDLPQTKIYENLITMEEFVNRINGILTRNISEVTEREIRLWAVSGGPEIIPRARTAGRVGMYSSTLIPLACRIKVLHALGFTLNEIHKYLVVFGKYKPMEAAVCSVCHVVANSFTVTSNTSCVCSSCETGHSDAEYGRMKVLTYNEVIAACAKVYPSKPLAISTRDLREWTYSTLQVEVPGKNGRVYIYGQRKLIPDAMKIEGKRAYYENVVPLLIRIRELQLHNLNLEDIRNITNTERKTGKRIVLCRDCGKNLNLLSNTNIEAVCNECHEKVVYNHMATVA